LEGKELKKKKKKRKEEGAPPFKKRKGSGYGKKTRAQGTKVWQERKQRPKGGKKTRNKGDKLILKE